MSTEQHSDEKPKRKPKTKAKHTRKPKAVPVEPEQETPVIETEITVAEAEPAATVAEHPEIKLNTTPAVGKPGRFLAIAVNGVGELHRDILDLNSAVSRKRFIGTTMQKAFAGVPGDDWPSGVRDALEKRLLDIAAIPPGVTIEGAAQAAPTESVDPRIEALAKMPEEIRDQAAAMLNSPDLVKMISADIAACGVVGETRTALSLYFVGASAQLARPLAAITRGSSSSGKSFVVDRVSWLFPPEVVLQATSITTNALYYFPPGTLRHRWVVCGERSRMEDDDRAEATRALREMIESGRLSKAVPGKDANGKIVTEVIEQEGPIAFVETTTLTRIFEEDANRCLLLASDETEEQTKKILAATAQGMTGTAKANAEHIRAVHHAMQRMIPRTDVEIPFADAISELFPTDRLECRRSFRHVLQLVKAVALLHFQQRRLSPAGLLVAELVDYKLAASLAAAPLAASRGDLGDATRKFFDTIKATFGDDEFDSNEAGTATRLQRSVSRDRLSNLSSAGLIEQTVEPKGNKPAKWKITGKEPESIGGGVPSMEELQILISARTLGRRG